jgi:hypothetical protein
MALNWRAPPPACGGYQSGFDVPERDRHRIAAMPDS